MYLFLYLKVGSAPMEKVTLLLLLMLRLAIIILFFEFLYPFAKGFFSTSPSLLQGELHHSHQASLPSGTRGCNRP